jgi:peroxiredoxin
LLAALLLVLATAGTALVFAWQRDTRAKSPATGAAAPDFSLQQIDGKPLQLSDYRGKVVLLDFWATWCAPCKQEIPRFIEWQRKYGGQGLQVIGISMDDTADPVRKYARTIGINYPVALADEKVVARYGGILGVPVNFVIARDGGIVSKHVGETDLVKLEQELTSQLSLKK